MVTDTIKYFFKTSAIQRQFDKKRYDALKKYYAELDNAVYDTWQNISADFPEFANLQMFGGWCMKNRRTMSGDLTQFINTVEYSVPCKDFNENACCANRGCPMYAKNKEHFNAVHKRNIVKKQLDSFWADIYQHRFQK